MSADALRRAFEIFFSTKPSHWLKLPRLYSTWPQAPVGRRRPLRLSVSSRPGEPNITVVPKRPAAATTRDGTTAAGRVASIRGTTVVIPSAGPYSAKGGKVESMTCSGPRS